MKSERGEEIPFGVNESVKIPRSEKVGEKVGGSKDWLQNGRRKINAGKVLSKKSDPPSGTEGKVVNAKTGREVKPERKGNQQGR